MAGTLSLCSSGEAPVSIEWQTTVTLMRMHAKGLSMHVQLFFSILEQRTFIC